ncbi:DNA repair-related protein [Leucosporidium creatinivorum]|uniref:Inosine triphosphate pyrophosphatase n=1 Tax=Leucosporidium creatinivorum TaxID=106004 RepID=A0A1Y2G1U9_9BASI|nr:DNA repair-related protein [Leucosporidium creatinivorum]
MSTKLLFITGNAGKLREVKSILASSAGAFDLSSQDLDLPEIQGTTREVAAAKVKAAAEAIGGPCITEDTALAFSALGGLPGPYIKAFMGNLGHEGLNKMLVGFEDKSATAICTFAYSAGSGSEPILFEGKTEGKIVPARGPKNFGWDPIFEVGETGRTYAEMDGEEKNKLSHRYKALDLLRSYLLEQSEQK